VYAVPIVTKFLLVGMPIPPGDLGTRKRPGTSCKIESICGLKLLNISLTVLDSYLKFVPDIHFPVQDPDTKFQTISQKNLAVTSD
jgi:hypothetical protein